MSNVITKLKVAEHKASQAILELREALQAVEAQGNSPHAFYDRPIENMGASQTLREANKILTIAEITHTVQER